MMNENKIIDTAKDADMEIEMEEVVAVIHKDKSITLEPVKKHLGALERNSPLSESERLEIAREIINLLANKKCTAQEAEEILHSAKLGVAGSAIVQHLD